uniref:porin n=1 Tax=Paraburkholderia adhaesiva TaxID=2883244 RepID=UPI001F1C12A9|nr:porin [Paraburkholderia adhaesiva]
MKNVKIIFKKALAAIGVLGVFSASAHAQSSVTLYGSIDAGILYLNNAGGHSLWQQSGSALSNTYFGLRGAEDLGGGTKAIFRLQSAFNINNGGFARNESLFNRLAYVGLQSDTYGTLTLGRQFDSVVDYLSPLSLSGSGAGVNVAGHPLNNDNLGTQRSIANAVKFESANYSGFHFGGLYGFSNDPGQFANGRAWSVGAGYSNGPLKVAAAYDQLNNDPGSLNSAGAAADDALPAGVHRVFGVGAKYAFGPATVGVLWTHTKLQQTHFAGVALPLDARFDNVELNGIYNLTPALAMLGAYTYTFGKTSGSGTTSSDPKWHSVTLALDYSLTKRTDVYLAGVYQHASGDMYNNEQGSAISNTTSIAGILSPSTTANQAGAAVGLRHRF